LATERRLAAIMLSDIAGYSALMEREESRTFARLQALREHTINPKVAEFGGRVVKTTGDGFLAEFPSATAALGCGITIQRLNFAQEGNKDEAERFHLRMGINLGDIISDGDDVSGDGVNIAARLEPLAPPDGICISGAVRDQVREDLGVVLEDLGEQQVKNISRPIRAYRINLTNAPVANTGRPRSRTNGWRPARRVGASAVAIVLAVGACLGLWAYRGRAVKPASRPFDAMAIPFISREKQKSIQQFYPAAPGYKAVAISRHAIGWASGVESEASARQEALDDCQVKEPIVRVRCQIYAVGMDVVWSTRLPPMPLPVDVNTAPTTIILDPKSLPLVDQDYVQRTESDGVHLTFNYLKSKNEFKVLAIGPNAAMGWSTDSTTLQDSVRRSLEFCAQLALTQCLLIARGGYLTQPIPTSHKINGLFLFSSDLTIPLQDRDRLVKVYLGDNWRAIARGEKGTWEAVAGKATESEAASSALDLCGRNGDKCRIYAIGNFLVDELPEVK